MKRLTITIVLCLTAAGCATVPRESLVGPDPAAILVQATGTPFVRVTAGPVTAFVPSDWEPRPLGADAASRGFFASPHPRAWDGQGALPAGFSVTWVEAGVVGVASDSYYLAASGPIVTRLVGSPGCHATHLEVFADHAPAFMDGGVRSPGDFVARGDGICHGPGGWATRWSYFVAAPGYGPATAVGIPGSGLYVIAAVTREGRGARDRLNTLLARVRFGSAGIGDFVRAVRHPLVTT